MSEPAFPMRPTLPPGTTAIGPLYDGTAGMTLRDYFAAKALMNMRVTVSADPDDETIEALLRAQARTAYRFADAMLVERECAK